MKYRLSSDVGNSSTKAIIRLLMEAANYSTIKQKTLVSPNVTIPALQEEELAVSVAKLRENIIAHINSPALKRPATYAIGNKAVSVGRTKRDMNIQVGNKHTHEIPIIMTLGLIASKAVQDYYATEKELPVDINVTTEFATALPAREWDPSVAKTFENRFLNGTHVVDVYVNTTPVTVRITFDRVKATQEGVPAAFALIEGDESLLEEYHREYGNAVTNKDFRNRKLLLVDIGDGTTEFIYVEKGKPNNDLSDGERFGVGHAADEAKKLFDQDVKVDIKLKRQQFMDVIFDPDHHFHDKAVEMMDTAKVEQAASIVEYIQDMYLNTLSGNVDDIVVFGGGAAAFREDMYQELKDFTDSVNSRTLWIPKEKAASLNAEGLDILSEKVFFKESVVANG